MPVLPGTIALTNIADGASIVAADHRNNYAAIQAAVNQLLAVMNVDAKGDLLVATANDTLVNLAIGADASVLVADSSQASGMKWAKGLTLIQAVSSVSAFSFSSIPQTFKHLLVLGMIGSGAGGGATDRPLCRLNGDAVGPYDTQDLSAVNAAAASAAPNNGLGFGLPIIPVPSSADGFAYFAMFIQNYTAARWHTMLTVSASIKASVPGIMVASATHRVSAAVNAISIGGNGFTFSAADYTMASLYGIGG
jgi:hypothetical protein